MKTMRGQRHQKVPQKISCVFILTFLLLFANCFNKKDGASTINIRVSGYYQNNERLKVSIDNNVIFDKTIEDKNYQSIRFSYETEKGKNSKISFSVNKRDTSFNYHVQKENFLTLSLSLAYSQFLVASVDSANYWERER